MVAFFFSVAAFSALLDMSNDARAPAAPGTLTYVFLGLAVLCALLKAIARRGATRAPDGSSRASAGGRHAATAHLKLSLRDRGGGGL